MDDQRDIPNFCIDENFTLCDYFELIWQLSHKKYGQNNNNIIKTPRLSYSKKNTKKTVNTAADLEAHASKQASKQVNK